MKLAAHFHEMQSCDIYVGGFLQPCMRNNIFIRAPLMAEKDGSLEACLLKRSWAPFGLPVDRIRNGLH